MDGEHVGWGKQPTDYPIPVLVTGSERGYLYTPRVKEGGGVAHENMQPFIALYLCKKD
jgi:hypothetical protein